MVALLLYIAQLALYAAAAYGFAAGLARTIETLTARNKRKAQLTTDAQFTYADFNTQLRHLEANAGIDVRSLLRESRYVDPTPTADTLAAYDAHVKREARLKARRLRRERVAAAVTTVRRAFASTVQFLKKVFKF